MRRAAALAVALCSALGPAGAGDKCFCLYKGGKVAEGKTACIATATGPELARCGKFLNNTSWIRLGKACTPPQTSEFQPKITKIQISENNP